MKLLRRKINFAFAPNECSAIDAKPFEVVDIEERTKNIVSIRIIGDICDSRRTVAKCYLNAIIAKIFRVDNIEVHSNLLA